MRLIWIIWILGIIIISPAGPAGSDPFKPDYSGKEEMDNGLLYKSEINKNMIQEKYLCSVTEGIPLPAEWSRGGHAGGIFEGNVIVAGGTNWSKDKTTKYWLKNSAIFRDGRWIPGPDLPKPIAYSMYAYDKSGLYIAGGTIDGVSSLSSVYCLRSIDEASNWEPLPDLPVALCNGAGAILKGKFYVTCGLNGNEKFNRIWVLDLKNKESKWVECSPLPGIERMFPSLVACGKYLYLLGGLSETSPLTPINDIYRYDPVKNEWIRLKDLSIKGYAWVSQPVDRKHLILTGRADGSIHKGIWIIDLEDVSVNEAGTLITPSTTAPLVPISEKQWWLIGGEPDANKNRTEKVNVIILK